jgi:hypothetical protein
VLGWRQVLAASARKAPISSPLAAGAAMSGPMIEKRKCAQRSRAKGSVTELKEVSQRCGTGCATIWKSGYKAQRELTIGMLCGCSDPLALRDRAEKDKQAVQSLGG